ncbi:MAG: membrane protein insertase YidC [Propionibacteriaceae bacterium]|jgi:YidC/Oxa1 family membrane protein insertase|nr:membrane protein insertase YidC [Propionibacteriaceae bacterium]
MLNAVPLIVPMGMWEDLLGFLNNCMTPLYWLISGALVLFHSFFSLFIDPNSGWSWALSIIVLTMLVRTILIPLFVRQINSTRNMQLIGPKVKELQEKYKDDRERLGQETMRLYQQEGINPMASCLPILCQMPVFLGLFWVLNNAARGNEMPGSWITPETPYWDSLRNGEIFGAKISQWFWPIPESGWGPVQTVTIVMIVLMTATLFTTQLQLMRKNMPPSAQTGPMAQQQKIMLWAFPALYAFGGVNIPIGVLIYWLTTNLWTLGQQWILVHNNPAPGTPAYIDWEERMRAQGKDPDVIMAERKKKQQGKRKAAPPPPEPVATGKKKVVRPSGAAANPKVVRDAKQVVTRKPEPTAAASTEPVEAVAPDAEGAAADGASTQPVRVQRKKTSRAKRKN